MQRRIDRACRILLQTNWNIKKVAQEVGFENPHYFSRLFLKTTGLTATQYRKRNTDPIFSHLYPVDESAKPYPLNRFFLNRYIKLE